MDVGDEGIELLIDRLEQAAIPTEAWNESRNEAENELQKKGGCVRLNRYPMLVLSETAILVSKLAYRSTQWQQKYTLPPWLPEYVNIEATILT